MYGTVGRGGRGSRRPERRAQLQPQLQPSMAAPASRFLRPIRRPAAGGAGCTIKGRPPGGAWLGGAARRGATMDAVPWSTLAMPQMQSERTLYREHTHTTGGSRPKANRQLQHTVKFRGLCLVGRVAALDGARPGTRPHARRTARGRACGGERQRACPHQPFGYESAEDVGRCAYASCRWLSTQAHWVHRRAKTEMNEWDRRGASAPIRRRPLLFSKSCTRVCACDCARNLHACVHACACACVCARARMAHQMHACVCVLTT